MENNIATILYVVSWAMLGFVSAWLIRTSMKLRQAKKTLLGLGITTNERPVPAAVFRGKIILRGNFAPPIRTVKSIEDGFDVLKETIFKCEKCGWRPPRPTASCPKCRANVETRTDDKGWKHASCSRCAWHEDYPPIEKCRKCGGEMKEETIERTYPVPIITYDEYKTPRGGSRMDMTFESVDGEGTIELLSQDPGKFRSALKDLSMDRTIVLTIGEEDAAQ